MNTRRVKLKKGEKGDNEKGIKAFFKPSEHTCFWVLFHPNTMANRSKFAIFTKHGIDAPCFFTDVKSII